MHQVNTFEWNDYDFTGHLNDVVDSGDLIDKEALRSKAYRNFLSHFERQDICEDDDVNPESDAIKKLIHKSLMSNARLLPQNIVDNDDMIKCADEKTKNLFFQLMLIVDYEANLHKLANKFSEHNPNLFGFIFKAIDKFYVDLFHSSASIVDCDEPRSPDIPIDTPLSNEKPERTTRRRPAKRSSKKKKVSKKASNTISELSKRNQVSSTMPDEARTRRTPVRKCSQKKAEVKVEEPSSSSETSSDDAEEDVPSAYVKKDLLNKYLTAEETTKTGSKKRRWKCPRKDWPRIKCTFEGCSKMIVDETWSKKQHMLTHTAQKLICDECGKSYANERVLETHKRMHSGDLPYACDQCDKRYSQSSNLKIHKLTHTGEKTQVCDQCGKQFLTKYALDYHMNTHKDKSELPLVKCTFEGCSLMLLNQPSRIRKHARVHTGEKPFVCEVCGKGYPQADRLTIHMRSHTGDTPFQCKQCGKKFTLSRFLKDHMTVHTGERPWPCDLCDKDFTQRGSLWNHKRLVHKIVGGKNPKVLTSAKQKEVPENSFSSLAIPQYSGNAQHFDNFSHLMSL